MNTYILGYANDEDKELTQFGSEFEADTSSEEWVKVEAESLENAKGKYEETFLAWQQKQAEELNKL